MCFFSLATSSFRAYLIFRTLNPPPIPVCFRAHASPFGNVIAHESNLKVPRGDPINIAPMQITFIDARGLRWARLTL